MIILANNWLNTIQNFKDNLDLTKTENIPLNKTIDFILKEKDKALEDRFAQITIDYIFEHTEHPFYYMEALPLDIIISIFDELKPNIVGIHFYIKINSCITEALAYKSLIENGFTSNDKVPHQQVEDDFYLANEEGNHAFEVKGKLYKYYLHDAVVNKIRAKMYFSDYKKGISLKHVQVKEYDIDEVDSFILSILNNTSIIDIHFINKSCFQIQKKIYCKSSNNDIKISTIYNLKTKKYSINYQSNKFNIKLDIIENIEVQFSISMLGERVITVNYLNTKNEFKQYLKNKLRKIKEQKNKEIKLTTRGNDKFGGFIYLPIPWGWKWNEEDIKRSFFKLICELIYNLNIDFSIYVYLHQFENKEILIALERKVRKKIFRFKNSSKKFENLKKNKCRFL
jgi:hypothetical protein